MVLEIRRTQEQYRLLRGDRDRRREYRSAVSQQYLFLSAYLEQLSQELSQKPNRFTARFSPEVAWKSRSREAENGDAFRHFSGPGCCHYLLLCDGMGTGWAAAREARTAVDLLQRLLCAGFPAEQALESMNSLLILRGRAGAVTVDLARIRLDTGEASLYKWGASPSWVARGGMVEKIGTAGPPPGLDLSRGMEKAVRLSLKRGETLILASDGLDGEGIQSRAGTWQKAAAGELAAYLLEAGAEKSADDATVAVVRLHRSGLLT
jgi:stage II sporulation protein E